jgi:hypothetical protein
VIAWDATLSMTADALSARGSRRRALIHADRLVGRLLLPLLPDRLHLSSLVAVTIWPAPARW